MDQAVNQKLSKLDRRTQALADGTQTISADGSRRATAGWDAYEVLGKDGLARQANGQVSLAVAKEPAWHGLGTFHPQAMTVEQALQDSGNAFTALKVPIFGAEKEDSAEGSDLIGSHVLLKRNDNGMHLGVVGHGFTVIQPLDAYGFLDELVAGNGLTKLDTTGMLADGTMFMSLALPESITLDAEGANDVIQQYITALNRFDGTMAFRINVSPFRAVCGNTVRWGTQHAVSSWRVHHRKNALRRIEEARRTLKMSNAYFAEFEREATALIQHGMSNAEFDNFLASIFPIEQDTKKLAAKRQNERRDAVRELYEGAPTQANIRGTAWAAEQAYVEWLDWKAGVRPTKTLSADLVRAQHTLMGTTDELKTHAHRQLLTLTNRWRCESDGFNVGPITLAP